MSNFIDIEQNSPDWFNLRLGLFTSSQIYVLMQRSRSGGFSKSAETYIKQKAIELIYPLATEGFSTSAMQWGHDHEPDARNVYELQSGKAVTNGGFWKLNDYTGSSPDGLIDDGKGSVEIKCPYNRINHLSYSLCKNEYDLLAEKKEYFYQCHHQMLCTGREYVDFMSYDPRLLSTKGFLHIIRIERDQEIIEDMMDAIDKAGAMRDEMVNNFLNK